MTGRATTDGREDSAGHRKYLAEQGAPIDAVLEQLAPFAPGRIRPGVFPNRAVYRRCLAARASELPPDSPAAHGMVYRLFKDLVEARLFRQADLVFEGLRDSYARVYGIDLDRPSTLSFGFAAGLSFEQFAQRLPFNVSGVLYLQGRCELADRGDPRRAAEYFQAAIRAGAAVRAALQSVGTAEEQVEDQMAEARLHLILGLGEFDAAAALAEFRCAGARPGAGGAGDPLQPLRPEQLERARDELLVVLVRTGAFAAAESLRALPRAASGASRSRPVGLRVALARLALASHFGRALLPLTEAVRSWVLDQARLLPRNRDYVTEIRSLARRAAGLLAEPGRLAAMALFVVRRPFTIAFGHLSYWRGLVRRRTDFVEQTWSGQRDLASAEKVAIFSHFDADGVLHDFVAYYLRQIAEAGFTIVFVSNASRLRPETVERLRPWCGLILRRANIGYDFGAYKDGLARIPDLRRVELLLLANDSVYGPFRPLPEILAGLDGSADVWGITDSWEKHFHLQSYFLLFGRAALQAPIFSQFWSRWRYVNSKYWNISRGEIGLSRELSAHGLRCQALYPYRAAAAALFTAMREDGSPRAGEFDPAQRRFLRDLAVLIHHGRSVNSTHYFWDYLVSRQGCPFLKRELLRDNPMNVPFVSRWEQIVKSAGPYDTNLIACHLALSAPGRTVPDPIPLGRPYRPWFA